MYESRVTVDLPSQVVTDQVTKDRLAADPTVEFDYSRTYEVTQMGGFQIMRNLVAALKAAGLQDVTTCMIDRRTIYVDVDDTAAEDLELLVRRAQQQAIFRNGFNELQLSLKHVDGDMDYVIRVQASTVVRKGVPEVGIQIGGRERSMYAVAGETAADYAARIQAFVADADKVAAGLAAVTAMANRIANALRPKFFRAPIQVVASTVRIERPEGEQLARIDYVPFGEGVEAPTYRPAPLIAWRGAWADPFVYTWYDAYYGFRHLVMMRAVLLDGALRLPWVHVVEPGGSTLFKGDQVDQVDFRLWIDKYGLAFQQDGTARVDSTIPLVEPRIKGDPFSERSVWAGELY